MVRLVVNEAWIGSLGISDSLHYPRSKRGPNCRRNAVKNADYVQNPKIFCRVGPRTDFEDPSQMQLSGICA